MSKALLACLFAIGLAALTTPSQAAESDKINLRLFGDNVIEGWDGCRLAFWQNNRVPGEDEFAYVFFAPIPDGEALPAWIKIDDQVMAVTEVPNDLTDTGMLAPVQLYRSSDEALSVIIEILEQSRSERGIEVGDARLTFLTKNKYPFTARVKGLNGCLSDGTPEDGAEAGNFVTDQQGLSLGQPTDFDGLEFVPAGVMRAIANEARDCEPSQTPGYGSSYLITDAMMLWQVPCNLYAARGSSVFVVSFTDNPDYATVLWLPEAGSSAASPEVLSPQLEPDNGILIAESANSDSSCPTLNSYQLREAEGESVEFVLIEAEMTSGC